MRLLGRISFVLGATAVTLLAVGCVARHEPAPPIAAVGAPSSAPATPVPAPTWPDAVAEPASAVPDAAGARAANQALARRRATWVMQDLIGHEIPASRITVVSRGEDGTLCMDRSAACQSRNRRVHFLMRESGTVQISASPSR